MKSKTILIILITLFMMCSFTNVASAGVVCHEALPSVGGHGYSWHEVSFINYCPLCGVHDSLIWNPKGTYEGEWTCASCDADYCAVTGIDKAHEQRARLTVAETGSELLSDYHKKVFKIQ